MIKNILFLTFILLVIFTQVNSTLFGSNLNNQCLICSKCTECNTDILKDSLIDKLHEILQQNFTPKLIVYPMSIKKVYLTSSDVQYNFIYNTGLSIMLKVNIKTG